jgi:Lon protease-like protein
MAPTQTPRRVLPPKPSEEYLRKEAKRLARDDGGGLASAQRRLAHEYGYRNWSELIRHVKSLSSASTEARGTGAAAGVRVAADTRPSLNELLKQPVEQLQLSLRAVTGLQQEGIKHIGELIQRTVQDLLEVKNLGRKSVNEIKKALAEMGLSPGMRLEAVTDLPFLPLREMIAFPHVVYPVFVGRPMSIKAIESAASRKIPIIMAAQKNPAVENPGDADIYRTGVVGTVIKVEALPDGTLKALIEGKRRARIVRFIADREFFEAKTQEIAEPITGRVDKLLESVASAFVTSRFKSMASSRSIFPTAQGGPSVIADRVASHLPIEISEKQELLELLDPAERLEKILIHLNASS